MKRVAVYQRSLLYVFVRFLAVALFTVLTAIGAQIRIPLPFTPVPITLQVLPVLVSGAALGRNLGALSQLFYVLLGACGLPFFAGARGGFEVIKGYTGGYLLGFILSSYLIGWLLEKRARLLIAWLSTGAALFLVVTCAFGLVEMAKIDVRTSVGVLVAIALIIGGVIILARFKSESAEIFDSMICGLALIYLCGMLQLAVVGGLSLPKAALQGVVPFIAGDLLKILASLGLLKFGRRLLRENLKG